MSKDKAPLAIDFSKFTDEDLEAYEKGDMSVLSDKALEAIASYEDEFNKLSDQVKTYKEGDKNFGITTTVAGGTGALAAGLAPRTSQKLVDKLLPEDLRGGYTAPVAPSVVAKPTVAPAPGADYFSPFGAGEGAVKNATHNVDEVLKNKVAQAAIKTPGYVAPGNSLILQPSSSLPPPAAPATGSPVLPGAVKPKVGMPQMRAALQSPERMPANRLPSSIKGGAAAGFGANAIENVQQGNYGDAATSALGSGSSIAAMASNPKLARAGKLGLAATVLGKGYQALQGRNPEEKADGGVIGYAKGKAVKGGLEAAKKLFDPRFDKRVLEQEKLLNQVLHTERTGPKDIPKIYLPDYEGYPLITSMADRSAGGTRLKGVNSVMFNRPVELPGGQEFMYGDMAWASGINPVNQIMGDAVELKKKTGRDPLYAPWRMAPTGSDFAHMTGETMLAYAQSAMGKSQKKDLNNLVKKFIPDWAGVDDPRSIEQFVYAPSKVRKSIQNAMDRDLRDAGSLGLGEARLAISDPAQINAPEGGLMHVAKIHADKPIIDTTGHASYPKGVPGEGLGQLEKDLIVTELLPQMAKERGIKDVRNPSAQDIRALQMKPYTTIIDDKLLKAVGFAAGGAAKKAAPRIMSAAKKLILPPAENAARTQIIGTLPTYEKASNILRQQGATGRGIDFGAGLGEGAKALGKDFDTYEPFAKNWTPTYSNAADVPSDEYGRLTNLNVLNVVPREVRDEIVQDIGRVMQPGGMGIITTRGKDVMNAKGLAGPEPMSVITSRDTYQKGFNKDELEEYLKYMLGDNFEIGRLNLGPAGAMIKKKAEGGLACMKEGGSTPAWQRSEGKNPEGGLNAAGRASYNRETGGNLKAPQPEGGPRKKSFCARMEGMKRKNTSSATANDPDSRINKSLRKWKC
jgi:hypothetical protein